MIVYIQYFADVCKALASVSDVANFSIFKLY